MQCPWLLIKNNGDGQWRRVEDSGGGEWRKKEREKIRKRALLSCLLCQRPVGLWPSHAASLPLLCQATCCVISYLSQVLSNLHGAIRKQKPLCSDLTCNFYLDVDWFMSLQSLANEHRKSPYIRKLNTPPFFKIRV